MYSCRYLALVVILLAAGCSSSKKTANSDEFYLAAFEDFDPEEHPDVVPPSPPIQDDHDIPKSLETPSGAAGARQVRGYRVQLFSSRDKQKANEELEKAIAWWERHVPEANRPDRPPIYVEYEQPYYKVRLGDYRLREAAASMADDLARTFEGAFVVPATIAVR